VTTLHPGSPTHRRPIVRATLVLLAGGMVLLGACKSAERIGGPQAGSGGQDEPSGGTSGAAGAKGPSGGTGGPSLPPDAQPPADAPASGGTGGTGGAPLPESHDAPIESLAAADSSSAGDGIPDSDFLPGRPDIRLCKKEWSMEQCCAFLCSCLNTICADSAKAKPGLASCMSWCPKISASAARCHVYHCYISISPTGGINDHDSHCGHAANQVQGGGCPASVAQ
jgi:hypothetical protein